MNAPNQQPVKKEKRPLRQIPVKFYSPYDGSNFCMPDGKQCVFVRGMYETRDEDEIEELELCIQKNGTICISKNPMRLKANDAVLLRDVGSGQSSIGAFSSSASQDLAPTSGA